MQRRFIRTAWISLAIIGGSVVVSSAAIWFLSSALNTTADKIVAERTLLNERVHAAETLAQLRNDEATAMPYENAMKSLLPTSDELLSFPQWINDEAGADNLQLHFSFSGDQVLAAGDAPGYINFSATAAGDLGDIAVFLNRIESATSSKYLIALGSLDVTQASGGYYANITGEVYTQ